jgi:hypothetical protein
MRDDDAGELHIYTHKHTDRHTHTHFQVSSINDEETMGDWPTSGVVRSPTKTKEAFSMETGVLVNGAGACVCVFCVYVCVHVYVYVFMYMYMCLYRKGC